MCVPTVRIQCCGLILVLVLLGVDNSCASAQSFSVCVGVVWGLYWVARYFTGVVDPVGRLSSKYSYRRNLVLYYYVGRYMHIIMCWYSTVEIVSLCVAGGVIKRHMCIIIIVV